MQYRLQKGFSFHRLFSIFLLTGLALSLLVSLCGPGNVRAAAAGPKMQVRAGFDGYYKQVSWLPIQVNLNLSEGNPNFEGWVEASFSNFDPESTIYRRSVQLVAPASRTVWLYLPSDSRTLQEVQVRLLSQDGSELSSQNLPVKALGQGDLLLGVVSDDPSAANYLNGERLGQPFNRGSALFIERYYSTTRKAVPGPVPTARIAHLAPSDLPPEGAGWDSLDGLVLTDLTNLNLGDQAFNQDNLGQAAAAWLAQGRLLLAAGDSGLRRAGALSNLLPVKAAGSPTFSAFPDGLRQFLSGDNPPDRLLLANTTPLEGAAAVAAQGSQPLLVRRNFGLGLAWFLAADLKSLPASTGLQIWRFALADYEPRISYGEAHRQPVDSFRWSTEINPNTKVATLPETGVIVLVVLAYALLLGPLSYLALKKLGRRELGWVVAPALALLFSLGIYLTGVLTSGDPLVVSRFALLTVGETAQGKMAGGSVGLATIYSNSRVDFRLAAPEQTLTAPLIRRSSSLGRQSDQSGSQPAYVQQGPGGGYSSLLMGLNDQRSFVTERDSASGAGDGIIALLSAKGGELEGTLENLTGSDWIDLSVWKPGGRIYQIPLIKAGETITLSPAFASAKTSNLTLALSGYDSTVFGSASASSREPYMRHKEAVLRTVLGQDGEALPKDSSRVYLLAWKRATAGFPLIVENRPASPVDLTLLFEPLTLRQVAP